jgi:LPS-assembly protein
VTWIRDVEAAVDVVPANLVPAQVEAGVTFRVAFHGLRTKDLDAFNVREMKPSDDRTSHPWRICFSLTVFLVVTLQASFLPAADRSLEDRLIGDRNAKWQITADKMSYDRDEGLYSAEGNVVITRGGQVLKAKEARYNEKTGMVEAVGEVVLETNGDVLRAEKALFDLNSQTGKITKGRIFLRDNHYYISGDDMEKTGPQTYVVKGFHLTTCDGDKPDWSVTGSEVEITVEGYGSAKNAVFRIRDMPAFYLPYALFPAKTKRQSGVLPPAVGYSNLNGMQVEVPIYWAISDRMDATFYEQYLSERGLMQGLEYRYVAEDESKGDFLFDVLQDKIGEKDLSDPDQRDIGPLPRTNETRYWLRSRTNQQLPLGVKAKLDTDYVSDPDYFKEFYGSLFGHRAGPNLVRDFGRPLEDIWSPTRRSALRLDRDQPGYSLQAISSYYERPDNPPNDPTPQPLGGLDFSLLPGTLPIAPFFMTLDTDYGYIWREAGAQGQQASVTPLLTYPMWMGRYLQFEPSISYTAHAQWVDQSETSKGNQYRDAYDAQARFSTVLERIYDTNWASATKLMHKIVPSLLYNYRVYSQPNSVQPWFEPMDADGSMNRIALALDNFLDARKDTEKEGALYKQWTRFTLIQGYRLDGTWWDKGASGEKRPFEPLIGILTLRPLSSLYLDTEVHYDYYEKDIPFADVSLALSVPRSGGRADSIGVDYQYVKDGDQGFGGRAHINLDYGFSVGGALHRNISAGSSLAKSLYVDYQSQCWGVRVITDNLSGIGSIMVQFRLLGLGQAFGR